MRLTTPRLIIRRFTPLDLDDYIAYQSHPEVTRYSGSAPMSRDEARQFLATQEKAGDSRKDHFHTFAIEHAADRKVIGDVGFWIGSDLKDQADLGFQFHPDYHGKGYAFEAARAVMGFGFSHWNLLRITAGCSNRNEPSMRLIERLGLHRNEQIGDTKMIDGELHQSAHFSITYDQWLDERI